MLDKLFGKRGAKESAAGTAIATYTVGQPVWTPREYDRLAEEAYVKNVIVYRCINEIATAASSVPWLLFRNDQSIDSHDLLNLLERPNPLETGDAFFQGFYIFYLVAGNSYLEANRGASGTREPAELWRLRPDRMKVIPDSRGYPLKYRHEVNGIETDFEVDPVTLQSAVMHFKCTHPLNDWYGMSPVEAAAFSIDQHNQAGAWNQALLQNGANPTHVVIAKQGMTDDQYERFKAEIFDTFQGPRNSGRPFLAEGDLDVKEMGLGPREMDFNESLATQARNIALAFGVPPMLLGIPGDNTYSNLIEARMALWEQSIIPLLHRTVGALNQWLVPMYGDNLRLDIDLDDIPALAPKRKEHNDVIEGRYNSGLITRNEARTALQYDTVEGGDDFKQRQSGFEVVEKGGIHQHHTKQLSLMSSLFISNEIDNPELFVASKGLLERVFGELVSEIGGDIVTEIGQQNAFAETNRIADYIDTHSTELVTQINETSKSQLRTILQEAVDQRETVAQIGQRIADKFANFRASRATMIAQTESTNVSGFSITEAMKQTGITKKEWLTILDGFARDSHAQMDGQVVDVDGNFVAPSGAKGKHPGAMGSAAENVNCRCSIVPVLDGKSLKTMSPEERKALWNKREVKRAATEERILPVIEQIFTLQEDALKTRLAHMFPADR